MHDAEVQVKTGYSFVAKVKCPYCHKEQYIEVIGGEDCQIEECYYCGEDIHLFLIVKAIVMKKDECPVRKQRIKIVVGDSNEDHANKT